MSCIFCSNVNFVMKRSCDFPKRCMATSLSRSDKPNLLLHEVTLHKEFPHILKVEADSLAGNQ